MELNGHILTPAKPEYFDCGRQMHRIADEILFGNLNAKTAVHGLAGAHALVCMIRSNGRGVIQPMSDWTPAYDDERRAWLRTMAVLLNTSLGNGGAWFTAWTNNKEFQAIWFDRDGDVKVALDDDRPFARMQPAGPDFIINNCQQALGTLTDFEKEMEITPDQQVKAAQGETIH